MDENRVEGTARKVAGKAQEGIGRLTGDAKMSRYISFTAEKPCAITIVGTFLELWSGR
jgi:hypothetical protein